MQRARKKAEQRKNLLAVTEIRETRTRRQTQKPDYVYSHDADSEACAHPFSKICSHPYKASQDDGDEYAFQEDEEYNDFIEEDDYLNFRSDVPHETNGRQRGSRRSTRSAVLNTNGKRDAPDTWSHWRGERRSSRLGAPPDTQLDIPPAKRARTEESTTSATSADAMSIASTSYRAENSKSKTSGAAAVKPTEVVLEQVAGRKKSKFWFYAVEPIPGTAPTASVDDPAALGAGPNGRPVNGSSRENRDHSPSGSGRHENGMAYEGTLDGSLSPASIAGST